MVYVGLEVKSIWIYSNVKLFNRHRSLDVLGWFLEVKPGSSFPNLEISSLWVELSDERSPSESSTLVVVDGPKQEGIKYD